MATRLQRVGWTHLLDLVAFAGLPTSALGGIGRALFSFAIVSLGIETLVCAPQAGHRDVSKIDVLQIIPLLGTILKLAYVGGAILICCGVGLLLSRTAHDVVDELHCSCYPLMMTRRLVDC
jgi:hypothetical protein